MALLVPSCFRCIQLFATLWTVALQAPLSMALLISHLQSLLAKAVPSFHGSSKVKVYEPMRLLATTPFRMWH